MAAFFGAGLAFTATAVVCGLLMELVRAFVQVVLLDEINSRLEPDLRATAKSLISFSTRLLVFATAPLTGWLAQTHGTPAVFRLFCALYVLLLAAVCLPVIRRLGAGTTEPEPAAQGSNRAVIAPTAARASA